MVGFVIAGLVSTYFTVILPGLSNVARYNAVFVIAGCHCMYRGFVEKLYLRAEISCVPRGNKGFGNLQLRQYYRVIIIVSNVSLLLSAIFSNW